MEIVADAEGLTGRVGTAAVAALADRLGLTEGLSRALAARTQRRSAIDGGRVLRDLVVMLVDGGDAVSDLGALRDQPDLFGRVASGATAARVVAAVGPDELEAIREARAAARERAWALGAAPHSVTIDVDASLVTSHSEKEGAAATYKRGFGFHPMLAFIAETREAVAGILRPGNAGANTAADKVCVVAEALRQLPAAHLARATSADAAEAERIVVRCDAAGATHELVEACRELALRFSVGFPISEPLREAVLTLKSWRWRHALDAHGSPRDGAWVAELPRSAIPAGWPEGSRLIVRKERPHPGAQLAFSDVDGHRFQLVLTDRLGDARELERDHRARGDAENRVRAAKDCGMRNLPFHAFAHNEVWLELVLMALDLIAWTQALLLDGALATAEPKTLRYRLLHIAGQITRHARRTRLHIPTAWPWATSLLGAARRLDALPAP
ncbi:MAG: IS1380 family transposase [Actinomycetota bacterium]|nr:IS1380 family transposase [Actinomycetota bacterium]